MVMMTNTVPSNTQDSQPFTVYSCCLDRTISDSSASRFPLPSVTLAHESLV